MAKPRVQIYADLPSDMLEADTIMSRYGRWCVSASSGKGRCGSAEGLYRAPGGDALESRREPMEAMTNEQALRVQRALQDVDQLHSGLLMILYVPRRVPVEVQLRILRIPPQLSQVRHLEGLRRFWPRFRALEQESLDKGRGLSFYNALTSQLV